MRQGAFTDAGGGPLRAHWLAASALLILAEILLHPGVAGIDDISWLIEVSARILDGQRLYIDAIELNPPLSVWLYTPAVWLARTLHVAPEAMVDAQTLVCAIASLGVFAAIMQRCVPVAAWARPWWLAIAMAILTLMPNKVFGQRDYYVLLLLLPMLAQLIVRAQAMQAGISLRAATAVAAAAGIALKPHFAVCLLPLMLAAERPGHEWRTWALAAWHMMFRLETGIIGVAGMAYLAAIAVFTPAYFTDVLPGMIAIYGVARLPFQELVLHPGFVVWTAAFAAFALAGPRGSAGRLLALASAGAMVAYLAQGKGFMYQCFPMLALIMLAWTCALQNVAGTLRRSWRSALVLPLAMLLCAGGSAWAAFNIGWESGELVKAVARLQPSPRIFALSNSICVGHPTTGQLNGTFVGREPFVWAIRSVIERKASERLDAATLARIDAYADAERDRIVEDIRNGQPDIILVQIAGFDWSKWALGEPLVAAELAGYQDRGSYNGVQVLQRR